MIPERRQELARIEVKPPVGWAVTGTLAALPPDRPQSSRLLDGRLLERHQRHLLHLIAVKPPIGLAVTGGSCHGQQLASEIQLLPMYLFVGYIASI